MYVRVKDNNIERALRDFKKRVKNSNLLKVLFLKVLFITDRYISISDRFW